MLKMHRFCFNRIPKLELEQQDKDLLYIERQLGVLGIQSEQTCNEINDNINKIIEVSCSLF